MERPPADQAEGRHEISRLTSRKAQDLDAPQVPSSGTYDDTRGVLASAIRLTMAGHPILPCYVVNGGDLCTCGRPDRKTGEPCRSGKHPNFELAPNGLKDATKDPAELMEWFDKTGDRINFGWRLDGLGVVDIDTNDGKTSADTMTRLEAEYGELSPTLVIRTGRGGLQHVYELPEGIEDTSVYADELGTHVDFKRGAGHYVMVPGSKTVNVYRVESGDLLKRTPVDGWVLELARQRKAVEDTRRRDSQADQIIKANGKSGPVLNTDSWAAVRGWLGAAVKPGDDPERGNNNAAEFVITNNLVTGFPSPSLAEAVEAVTSADGLIAVTPVFSASYSGLFKSFFDIIDNDALTGKAVLAAATGGTALARPGARAAAAPRLPARGRRTLRRLRRLGGLGRQWRPPHRHTAHRITRAAAELAGLMRHRRGAVTRATDDTAVVPFEQQLNALRPA